MKTLDINQIQRLLPHRYPFLLVDRVLDYTAYKKITAIKNVTANEPFFQGHFPGHPVMPGVLLIEAMAQTGGIMMIASGIDEGKDGDFSTYFMSIDRAKFRKMVTPGDQLRFEVELTAFRMPCAKFSGKAYVEDKLVAETAFSCMVVEASKDKNSPKA